MHLFTVNSKADLIGAVWDEDDQVVGYEPCARCGCTDEPHAEDHPWRCVSCEYIVMGED